MKYLFVISMFLFALSLSSCDKENRTEGICYCEFVNGESQEYDLRGMTREEQRDQCATHDKNAANFGGSCELE